MSATNCALRKWPSLLLAGLLFSYCFAASAYAAHWSPGTAGASGLNAVVFGGGQFFAAGESGGVAASEDGASWTAAAAGTNTRHLLGAAYGSTPEGAYKYLVVGENGTLQLSVDGKSGWSSFTSNATAYRTAVYGASSGGSKFLAAGDNGQIRAHTGVVGASWSNKSPAGVTASVYGAASGPVTDEGGTKNGFVIVGAQGLVMTNTDAQTASGAWISRTPPGFNGQLNGVAYLNGRYIAVGDGGIVALSQDGVSWTVLTPEQTGTEQSLRAVAYGDGVYMAVGDNGTILSSPDGLGWTAEASGTSGRLRSVAYGQGRFVAVGDGGITVHTLSGNARLAALEPGSGVTLEPAFHPDALSYSGSASKTVETLQLAALAEDPRAAVKVNGLEAPSPGSAWTLPLATGPNTVVVEVYAEAPGVSRTYTLHIHREAAASADAALAGIDLAGLALTPAFDSGVKEYAAAAHFPAEYVKVSGTTRHSGAELRINGQPAAGGKAAELPLSLGNNEIRLEVTAEDGTAKEAYTVNVKREKPGYFSEDFQGAGANEGWFAYGGIGGVEADPDQPDNRVYRLKYNGDISIAYYYPDGSYWTDYSYEADVKLNAASSRGGLAFKVLDENNFYTLSLNGATGKAEIQGRTGGEATRTLAASQVLAVNPAEWNRLRVEVLGNTVKGYVNGIPAVEWTNPANDWQGWGKAGFRTQHEMLADHMRIEPLSESGAVSGAISFPGSYAVFQRDAEGWGNVRVEGFAAAPAADRVEARLTVMEAAGADWSGAPVDWTPLDFQKNAETGDIFFRDSVRAQTGGWYLLEVRGLSGGGEVFRLSREKVGVGDVYLVGGQSNAGNSGGTRMIPADDRVAAISRLGADAAFAKDPLHGVNGNMGSTWSLLGEKLVGELNIPVGIIGFGQGGTVVAQWLPEAENSLYSRLKQALHAADRLGGAKAVLWHQGETDSDRATTALEYEERLTRIILQSRADAGWNPELPWGIAVVSYSPYSVSRPERMEAVAEGHRNTVLHVPHTFLGADTDDLREGYRRTDEPSHLNEAGQREHAARWMPKLAAYFYGGGEPGPGPGGETDASVLKDVLTADGGFLAVGADGPQDTANGILRLSRDGEEWTTVSRALQPEFPAASSINGVASGGGLYAAAAHNGAVLVSKTPADPASWTLYSKESSGLKTGTNKHLYGIAYGDGRFLAVGQGGTLVHYGEDMGFRMYNNDSKYSYGGVKTNTSKDLYAVAYGNGRFVAAGLGGTILTTDDFLTFVKYDKASVPSTGTDSTLNGIAFGNGLFAAVGDNGVILTSPDGANWQSRQSGTTENLYGAAYLDGRFVAVGGKGTVLLSDDGVMWFRHPASGTSEDLRAATLSGEEYMAVGVNGTAQRMTAIVTPVADKTYLLAAIEEAEGLLEAAVEGTLPGQYVAGARARLQAPYDAAVLAAVRGEASQAEINEALSTLQTALQVFGRMAISETTGDLNGDGRGAVGDVAIAAAAYGKDADSAGWLTASAADFNQDGRVDEFDVDFLSIRAASAPEHTEKGAQP
ncbi:cadherin-like beta sandwich domain-containing protein [Paenibacillus sp. YN15]|uniref:cadherin-like beta sandwich domain-containing protein n=1 Tax=Paenibacillus sp. YN15 TaxID=1742774 RepID=UPI000DCDBC98|nr:cadherin-like beta sandwich domain-containing protein [Paenibacillus sp. YN15]RAV01708.1 hypothetical protein DQG13_11385 [Paenibacillus sp. YN15]